MTAGIGSFRPPQPWVKEEAGIEWYPIIMIVITAVRMLTIFVKNELGLGHYCRDKAICPRFLLQLCCSDFVHYIDKRWKDYFHSDWLTMVNEPSRRDMLTNPMLSLQTDVKKTIEPPIKKLEPRLLPGLFFYAHLKVWMHQKTFSNRTIDVVFCLWCKSHKTFILTFAVGSVMQVIFFSFILLHVPSRSDVNSFTKQHVEFF